MVPPQPAAMGRSGTFRIVTEYIECTTGLETGAVIRNLSPTEWPPSVPAALAHHRAPSDQASRTGHLKSWRPVREPCPESDSFASQLDE
jgi:hypothetical protein